MGLPYIDIGAYDIDPNAALLVKLDLMRRYALLPIKLENDELTIAMADPANISPSTTSASSPAKEIRRSSPRSPSYSLRLRSSRRPRPTSATWSVTSSSR